MTRMALIAQMLIVIAGCRAFEHEGANPLPENAPPLTYAEMVSRARGQATAALDAFYVDAWLDLEQAAQRLEQSARFLPKTTQIPETFQTKIDSEAEALRKDALKLIEAARNRNAKDTNEAMRSINDRIRALRPAEKKITDPEGTE